MCDSDQVATADRTGCIFPNAQKEVEVYTESYQSCSGDYNVVTTAALCEQAAGYLGWSDPTAYSGNFNGAGYPKGRTRSSTGGST